MDHPAFGSERIDPALSRPVTKLVFLAQLGFVGVSLCLSVVAGYFSGTVTFVNALLLFVLSGAVTTLAWRYVAIEVQRLDVAADDASEARAKQRREPDLYVVR